MNILTLLLFLAHALIGVANGSALTEVDGATSSGRPSLDEVELYLQSIGYSIQDLCHEHYQDPFTLDEHESYESRTLGEEPIAREGEEEEGEGGPHDTWFYVKNAGMAFLCVTVAALAAGLTMGLASQELLDLKIKEMAGNPREKKYAKALIPLLQDHHRLLVTLLLINALANEALPLFLDKVVSPLAAVVLSVTMVLFFGEIIPSAIFSGSNKLAITSALAPLVQVILFLFYPLAKPIGKLLDVVLHDEEDDGFHLQKYDRKELSALVRLQYEERKATKLKAKAQRVSLGSHEPEQQQMGASMRFIKAIDTVTMVEGALEMQSKRVADVMIKIDKVFAIPYDAVLDEARILQIYRMGFSRVPVYDQVKKQIVGIFKTRQLMVVNTGEKRLVSNLPLIKPHCVSPNTDMQSLVNLLQTGMTAGKGGHMALVCEDPSIANDALDDEETNFIPLSAGVLGIVTLENCVEVLIQEEIYDEYDQAEKQTLKRAKWATKKWKKFVEKKKSRRNAALEEVDNTVPVAAEQNAGEADETTRLLPSTVASGGLIENKKALRMAALEEVDNTVPVTTEQSTVEADETTRLLPSPVAYGNGSLVSEVIENGDDISIESENGHDTDGNISEDSIDHFHDNIL